MSVQQWFRSMLAIGLVIVALTAPRDALAQWSRWDRVAEDRLLGSPVCVSWGIDRLDCFLRGADRTLVHYWWEDGNGDLRRGFSGQSLGGALSDDPSCVSIATNRLDCLGRGTDGALWHIAWRGGGSGGPHGWTPWARLGSGIVDSPSCVSWRASGQDRIDCFARGQDRAMYQWTWDGSRWRTRGRLGGILIDRPDCFSGRPDRLHCYARGTDQVAYVFWWDGVRWSGWLPVGGRPGARTRFSHPPSCVSNRADEIDCFGLRVDGRLVETFRTIASPNAGDWVYATMPPGVGSVRGRPICAPRLHGRVSTRTDWQLDCFVVGSNRELHQQTTGPLIAGWPDGWLNRGGQLSESPGCVGLLRHDRNAAPGGAPIVLQDMICMARGQVSGLYRINGPN